MTAGESEFTMSTKSEVGRLGIELADLRQEQETIEAEVGATALAVPGADDAPRRPDSRLGRRSRAIPRWARRR